MDTNGIAETVDASVPDMLDHFFRAYDTVLMKKEIFQQRTFLSGQRKGESIDTGLSCTGIKADTSALQTHILLDEFSSCQTSDPCLQLFKMKRSKREWKYRIPETGAGFPDHQRLEDSDQEG